MGFFDEQTKRVGTGDDFTSLFVSSFRETDLGRELESEWINQAIDERVQWIKNESDILILAVIILFLIIL